MLACLSLQELEPSTVRTEAEQEMATITSLTQQHISRLVGLPGLAITADPGEQLQIAATTAAFQQLSKVVLEKLRALTSCCQATHYRCAFLHGMTRRGHTPQKIKRIAFSWAAGCAGGQTGPGCVIWEAGVHLARLFVQLAALQQQGPAHPHANSMPASAANTAPACKHSHVSPTAAASSPAGGAQQGVGTSVQLECVGLQQLPRLQGARLLELGAGTGIAGITAAACGAHAVLTDLPQVQPLLQANIAGNKPLLDAAGGSATAAVLDWAEAHQHEELLVQGPIESGEHAAAGTIISNSPCTNGGQHSDHTGTSSLAVGWSWGFGADLVFNSAQLEPAVLAISTFLRSAEASVSDRPRCFLLAHKQRHLELDKQLLHALAAAGCVAKEVHWSSECAASQVCVWLLVA